LQLPGSASTSLYADADLTRWINIARGQIAGEGQCLQILGTISTVIGQRPYPFQGVNVGTPINTGVQGIINIGSLSYVIPGASGELWLPPRPWPWFTLFELNGIAPQQGPPRTWAQFGQGAAPSGAVNTSINGGTFYLSPPPDDIYQLNCYATGYPIPLVGDADAEALPYLWTDAVPFFAAYFGLMSAQTNARMAEAANMYKGHYNEFMNRARKQSNPSINNWQYLQSGDPAQGPKMGIGKGGAG
jgi:hypothetical protein